GIQRPAYYGAAGDQLLYLVVAELAVMIYQRAAIVVAGPYMPVEMIQRVPEAVIAEMRGIQDNVKALHFLQQRMALRGHDAGSVCALGIAARAIVRRPYGAQPVFVGPLQVVGIHNGVCPFQAQDVAYGLIVIRRAVIP